MKKKLANGTICEYHYAFRGGPKFWDSWEPFAAGTPEYWNAYWEKLGARRSPAASKGALTTAEVIRRYRASPDYTSKDIRTRKDYDKFLDPFEAEFGEDSIRLFEDIESVAEIRDWKQKWAHSLREYDYATAVVTLFLNWAKNQEKCILVHHHIGQKKHYKAERADIVWRPEEIQALLEVANEREKRIIWAAQGGLSPQDVGIITRHHVEETPGGRRIQWRRTKTGKPFNIPVTDDLARLIDTTPPDQEYLVVSLRGKRLKEHRVSGIVRDLKARANEKKPGSVRKELRPYDLRETAATRLLRAGCSLNQIAVCMGWGVRHAANVIQKYVALVPEESDRVRDLLRDWEQADRRRRP
ncbi:tyrosine-type recombinase/integrase [Tranquillimonas alkanivorans]|uniref:tyrosine-type recombinase/integrase n=1 Tax=Tranquillimonas alkanivorans TaxID=441119 RepID=UPI0015A64E9D|nr:tyrosine-type recombinase/integrase [Tranquillimonas alkanivorans]